MDRYKNAKTKYPFLKLRLCYYCFKENFRNKTAFRQKYFLIRNYILKYFKAADVSYDIKGMNELKEQNSILFVVKATNEYEKLLAYSALCRPVNLILDDYEFQGFINKNILKYLNAKRISSNDELNELDTNLNYIKFVDNFDDLNLNTNIKIVKIDIVNGSLLFDEFNHGNIKINFNVLK